MSGRKSGISRRDAIIGTGVGFLLTSSRSLLAEPEYEPNPHLYFAHVSRVLQALRLLGEPLLPIHDSQLSALMSMPTVANVKTAEQMLARYTLMRVHVDARALMTSQSGHAETELVEQGWRSFLVRVENPFGLQCSIALDPNTLSGAVIPEGDLARRLNLNTDISYLEQTRLVEPNDIAARWLGYEFFKRPPLSAALSGMALEYQVLQLYSRDRGSRSAYLEAQAVGVPFVLVYGQKRGFAASFTCLPSSNVSLSIKDSDGEGTTASLVMRDSFGRLYPAPAHRLEPDFDFQPQVYRADGERIRLPAGSYTADFWRGPEYLQQRKVLKIEKSDIDTELSVHLDRWINSAALGWYPGDPHLHAAGCAHYDVPTMGVTPETMLRHVRGEGLSVGNVLTWGPGYYYQKKFFTGHIHVPTNALAHSELQRANNTTLEPREAPHDRESIVRWDVEISGFPSSHSGHLVLLNLKEQTFPGAERLEHWPSWNLPILKWARAQGAVVGYAHCGLMVDSTELPNYELPAFDLVGANEFLVDVTHDAVDFIAGTSCQATAELNLWYHALNCGFRVVMVGETDFPCLWERAGNGRTYVGLDRTPEGDAGFTAWITGIQKGRLYFGDGRSHFIDYRVNGHSVGGDDVTLAAPGTLRLTARVAARLEELPIAARDERGLAAYSFWHIEHARISKTRSTVLEVIENGRVVRSQEVLADGNIREFSMDIEVSQSSWVAMRILPSGHTAPVYVRVAGQPIRASKRSAQWCHDCLNVLWREKAHRIRPSEREQAEAAYEYARTIYLRILSECRQD